MLELFYKIKEKNSLKGVFSIYPLLPSGETDYKHLLYTSKNQVQFQGLNLMADMLDGVYQNAGTSYNGFYGEKLWMGTNAQAVTRFDASTTGTCRCLLTPTEGPYATSNTSFVDSSNIYTLTKIFNIATPVAGTYQELGIDLNGNNQIGFSRVAFPFTLTSSPVSIVYTLSWSNGITNNSALLSANSIWSSPYSLVSTIKGFLSSGYSTGGTGGSENATAVCVGILNTDSVVDPTYSGIKIGQSFGFLASASQPNIPYKGNGTGPNGLTGATKIQNMKQLTFTQNNVPVGTYTSFYINTYMQINFQSNSPTLTVYQKLINLVISNPVNTVTIVVDWIIE